MKRIICPFHKEKTPSLCVYGDHYYCYGCGKNGLISDLGIEIPLSDIEDPEPEDLEESLKYIEALPRKEIRGLLLPYDRDSYYIVWPDRSYYKRRFFTPWGSKYIGAAGHRKPPFWVKRTNRPPLLLIEGELNALSISKACPELDICSPGGCGDFSYERLKKYYQYYSTYASILLVLDSDAAGAKGCMQAIGFLKPRGIKVTYALFERDANEILQKDGCAALRRKIQEVLEKNLGARP